MKKHLVLFAAAALCASAQENAAPAALEAKTAEAVAALEEACPAPAASAPDVALRVKSLDSLREAVTAVTTLAGQPQAGLMATMGLTAALGQAGLSGIRPADPACVWVWDVGKLVEAQFDDPPPFLVALPVDNPSESVLDDAFDRRVESDDPSAPAVWTEDDELFVTVRAKHLLAASSPDLFDRAEALLAEPAALPDATVSFSSGTLRSWFPQMLDLIQAEQEGDLVSQLPDDVPEWVRALVAFAVDLQRLQREQARDCEAVRAGFHCDLERGLSVAGAVKAAPGTKAAERLAAVKTPLAPDALAGIPAASFFWGVAADAGESPDRMDGAAVLALVRKHLLPLVKDEALRAALDENVALAFESTENARGVSFYVRTDDAGRLYIKGSATLRSEEKYREACRRSAALFRGLTEGLWTNAAAVVESSEDGLTSTVHVRPLVDAVTANVPELAAKIVTELPDADEDPDEVRVKLSEALDDSMRKKAAAAAVAFLGEDWRAQSVVADGRLETTGCAVGATVADGPAVSPDFRAEDLYFPGQMRIAAFGFDMAGALRDLARTAAAAADECRKISAEDGGDAAEPVPALEALKNFALSGESAPIHAFQGMKDGEYTQVVVVSPACFRSFVALGEFVEYIASPTFDDGEIEWGEDDDVEFDDDDFDDGDEPRAADDDPNEYGNPDPAELEDEDFDDDEF